MYTCCTLLYTVYVIILCHSDISWCFLQHCFGLHDASRDTSSASRQHGYTALLELKQRHNTAFGLQPEKKHTQLFRIIQAIHDCRTIWNLEYRSWDPLHHGDLKSPMNAKLWAPARITPSQDEKSVILWHIILQPWKLRSIASHRLTTSIQPSISLLPSHKFHPSVAARVEVEISAPRANANANISTWAERLARTVRTNIPPKKLQSTKPDLSSGAPHMSYLF